MEHAAALRASLAGEERGLDRGERAREQRADRIALAGEREHPGQRVVREQLAVELAATAASSVGDPSGSSSVARSSQLRSRR